MNQKKKEKKKISVASRLKNDKGWMDTYHKTNNKFEYTITSEKRTLTIFTQANGRRDLLVRQELIQYPMPRQQFHHVNLSCPKQNMNTYKVQMNDPKEKGKNDISDITSLKNLFG